ncbi:MAG: hypothetical protein HYZ53_09295 [Planctomycetes bacterium]|nr:hypothetical protein [Planctomycetota bacterium]
MGACSHRAWSVLLGVAIFGFAQLTAAQGVEDEVWITNRVSGTLTVVGSASGDIPVIKNTFALGLIQPQDAAFSPNGQMLFVNSIGTMSSLAVDTFNGNAVTSQSAAAGNGPYGVATGPFPGVAGDTLIMVAEGNIDAGTPAGTTISFFQLGANTNIPFIPALGAADAGANPVLDCAIAPDGSGVVYTSESGTSDPGAAVGFVPPALRVSSFPAGGFVQEALSNTGGGTTGSPGSFTGVNSSVLAANQDIRSGHILTLDPLNRRIGLVIATSPGGAGFPIVYDHSELHIHRVEDPNLFDSFDDGTAQFEFVGVNAHPNGLVLYASEFDTTAVQQTGRLEVFIISGVAAVNPADDATNTLQFIAGEVPVGVAFTRDGTRGYVILDRGLGAGALRTFRVNAATGLIVAGSLSAPLSIGVRPSSITNRGISTKAGEPPGSHLGKSDHKCFVGALGAAQDEGSSNRGRALLALVILAAAAVSLRRRVRIHGRA